MASNVVNHNKESTELFAAALDNFKSSLSDQDLVNFKSFQSPQSMIQAIREPFQGRADKSRVLAVCEKVENFSKKFENFFPAVNIFVSSHPEYAAIAWGAIRLVFQLSSQYVSYFEKLGNMFEDIGEKLPFYDRQIEILRSRAALNPRLLDTLAQVYVDIIQFCQEAYKIFYSPAKGIRGKLRILREVVWKPFDVRFSDLLRRLQKHHDLYQRELELVDTEQLNAHYAEFDAEVERNEKQRRRLAVLASEDEKRYLKDQLRHAKTWINAPSYTEIFDREKETGTGESGRWLLDDKTYVAWRDVPNDDESTTTSFNDRTLRIHANPGYGKTVLSTVAIQDLMDITARSSYEIGCSQNWKVAYFHYDKMITDQRANMPHQALRALLNQVIHHHHQNKDVIDAISMIMDHEGSGQVYASEVDVASMLKLLLERFPTICMYFVVDGVDECTQPSTFLQMLFAICANSTCKIMFLSRPNIKAPWECRADKYHIKLEKSRNMQDICAFSRLHLARLQGDDLLPRDRSIEDMAMELAERANGLFLWVKLMVDYLECPAISRRDRLHALQNLNLIEGLDGVYYMIFQMLHKKMTIEKRTVLKIFQWLATSCYPLTLDELNTAISLRLHESHSPDLDLIPGFAQSLSIMCAGLVEIRHDNTVHFIHLSVKEFLTMKELLTQQHSPGEFHVDLHNAHLVLASYSLSYLVHGIPDSPLSGSSQIVRDIDMVSRSHPLLQYSTKWCSHVVDALAMPDALCADMLTAFVRLLERFLQLKTVAKVWAEACWTFKELDHSDHLTQIITLITDGCASSQSKSAATLKLIELSPLVQGLLSDWNYLLDEWQYLLRDSPFEIWQESINCTRVNGFFLGTEMAKMTILSSEEIESDSNSQNRTSGFDSGFTELAIVSQVSDDSERVASVKLLCPQEFTSTAQKFFTKRSRSIKTIDKISAGWEVEVTAWTTGDVKLQTQDFQIKLPDLHVWLMLAASSHLSEAEEEKFRMPVTFSPDLKTILVLHTIIRLTSNKYEIQSLDDGKLRKVKNLIRKQPHRFKERDLTLTPAIIAESFFSPRSELLAVVTSDSPHNGPKGTDHYDCVIDLYHTSSPREDLPRYRHIAKLPRLDWLGGTNKLMIIHPSAQLIVFTHKTGTFLWNIREIDVSSNESYTKFDLKDLTKLHSARLDSLSFSSCGQNVIGSDLTSKAIIQIALNKFIPDDAARWVAASSSSSDNQVLALGSSSSQHTSGEMIISSTTGQSLRSTLSRQYGTISLEVKDDKETSHVAQLLQLPQSSFRTTISPTLLPSQEDSTSLRLVLNKAAQSTYSLSDSQDFALPRLLTREKESVPMYSQKRTITAGDGASISNKAMEHGPLVKRAKVCNELYEDSSEDEE